MIDSRLVARDRELDAVLAAVRSAGAVVTGEAGVGKTLLAHTVAQRARDEGDQVVWVVATAASRPMPFGALAVLLTDEIASLHPALVFGHVARHLAALAATGGPGGGGGAGGAGRLPLLVVDDAHLLDNESAATILALVTSGTARLLATVRADEPVPDAVLALWKDGFVGVVEVRPLDRAAAHDLVAGLLRAEVATTTARLLWRRTGGNPLYLTELVHYGRAEGRLVDTGGVWIWQGDLDDVPPRLGDLLDRHLDGLSSAGLDALGAVALAEPLPFDTLAAVVPAAALSEVEDRGLVVAEDRAGVTWARVAHPLIAEAAKRRLTAVRRRRVAGGLVAAGPQRLDPVRLASLQLDAGGDPDVDQLVAGARAVLLRQPALALRFAERAAAVAAAAPGPPAPPPPGERSRAVEALVVMADAHAELGRADRAQAALGQAAAAVRSPADHLLVRTEELALLTWARRRPHEALAQLVALRAEAPLADASPIDSTIALVTLFTARPADTLARADAVLAAGPAPDDRIRATVARVGGLAMTGRSAEACAAADALTAELPSLSPGSRTLGIGYAICGLARYFSQLDYVAETDPQSRWPVPLADGARVGEAVGWPLLEGVRRLVEGNVGAAVPLLREAYAQQVAGEGHFRSEATAQLVRGLVAAGEVDEAAHLLADTPPDDVAVVPALRESCEAAVAAARGEPGAVAMALTAARVAAAAGGVVTAVAGLSDAARYGGVAPAVALLDELGPGFEFAPTAARASGLRAQAAGDGAALLDAAERHAAARLWGDAIGFADSAAAALRRDTTGARARALLLAQDCRTRLGLATQAARAVDTLTRRELEVARLAVTGMSDRAIAETLVVSVRTAESHVAAIYRKLGISSRATLTSLLTPD